MHVIGQIRIETSADGGKLARQVDRAVAAGMDEEIPRVLGECFDRVGGDHTLRMDKLEIDLGRMTWAEFNRGFAQRVAAAVMARLNAEAAAFALEDSGEKRELLPEHERLEAWLYFLRHGHLPWWFSALRWSEIASVRKIHAADPERVLRELRCLAEEFPAALVRLARHATTLDLEVVLKEGRSTDGLDGNTSPHAVIFAWLMGLSQGANLSARFFSLLSQSERAKISIKSDDMEGRIPHMRTELANQVSGAEGLIVQADFTSNEASSSMESGIPVVTAGLVLLHPFLGRFFRHLGWLDEAGGILPDCRWDAVQALQFLALGRAGLPEPTLLIEKMLCGIPLHEAAEFPELDETVRAECENMLEAMVGHWSVLGKTSVDGLREAFLTRPGVLYFEMDRVRLALEPRPFDMLLTKLPWSLGPVMFRWLAKPIQVRWGEHES